MKKVVYRDLSAVKMAGTERTYEYKVVARSSRGTLGVRDLGDFNRIRLEPTKKAPKEMGGHMPSSLDWKQPGDSGENRFSLVVPKQAERFGRIEDALIALGLGEIKVEVSDAHKAALARYLRDAA